MALGAEAARSTGVSDEVPGLPPIPPDTKGRDDTGGEPIGSVRSRKFGGDAVLHVDGWYHCQCYPCPNLTKWLSIGWNSNVCPSCMVAKQRTAKALEPIP